MLSLQVASLAIPLFASEVEAQLTEALLAWVYSGWRDAMGPIRRVVLVAQTAADADSLADVFANVLEVYLAQRMALRNEGTPEHWTLMEAIGEEAIAERVELEAWEPEYEMVQDIVQREALQPNLKLQSVYRVQSRHLRQQFAAHQTFLMRKHSAGDPTLENTIERTLFHGTAESAAALIEKNGFDYRWCGKNATMYGQGPYFARDLKYSAQDLYSVRNAKGQKFIFIARVLVAKMCKGDASMRHLAEPYDTSVDDVANPSIFVTYKDAQACPDYLMIFSTS